MPAARLLLLASIAWLALLALTASAAADSMLSAAVHRFASFICHQQPDRTFHWGAAPWAVCARCLGLYAAAPFGVLTALIFRPGSLSRTGNFLLLCIAGMPTLLTWVGEHVFGWPMTNAMRFTASLPLGAAVAWVIARTLGGTPSRRVSQYTLPDARRG